MFFVLRNSWALLLGMFLLLMGNGVQGTLLGVRGAIEGFSASEMSFIMSGYFIGFLGGSRMTPGMIRRVGHVRVFAALASFISAAFLMFAAWPNEYAWFVFRVMVGFCFSGVYVVAESWLNDSATNETRGKTLSAYLIVQMLGMVVAQAVVNFADPSGFVLFAVISIAVSISFAPILLSVSPAPVFQTTKPMSIKEVFVASPLGVVGTFSLGAIFSAIFGMAAVYGTERGLTVAEITIFTAAIYVGGLVAQYPIGWASDRMDRRTLIILANAFGAAVALMGVSYADNFYVLLGVAAVIGGMSNPLYSLYIAYTNDYLDHDDMAAASGGMIFVNGVGAIGGPLVLGWMMTQYGPSSFFLFIGILMALMTVYAIYRISQRPTPDVEETIAYQPIGPTASPVVVEVAQEIAIEAALEEAEEANS